MNETPEVVNMNELARSLLAVCRAHHNNETYEEALVALPRRVHPSWDEVARRFYGGFCEGFALAPLPENAPPTFRIVRGGADDGA